MSRSYVQGREDARITLVSVSGCLSRDIRSAASIELHERAPSRQADAITPCVVILSPEYSTPICIQAQTKENVTCLLGFRMTPRCPDIRKAPKANTPSSSALFGGLSPRHHAPTAFPANQAYTPACTIVGTNHHQVLFTRIRRCFTLDWSFSTLTYSRDKAGIRSA